MAAAAKASNALVECRLADGIIYYLDTFSRCGFLDLFREVLPALDFLTEQTKLDTALIVRQQDLRTVIATGLRNPDLGLAFLRNMTAVDWEENGLEIVYHRWSCRSNHHTCRSAGWFALIRFETGEFRY